MTKALAPLGCILLAIFLTSPQLTAATPNSDRTQTQTKVTRARKVSQIDLKSIKPLMNAFERDNGKVRLLTILSPT